MEEIVKHINDTNASFRTPNAGDAKNTDLFLDNEQYDLFKDEGEQITVRYNKENLSKAILFIASILPRKYDNSGMHKSITYSSEFVYDQLAFLDYFFKESGVSVDKKTQKWNVRKNVPKKNGEIDNRFYFNGLLDDVEYVNVKKERVSSKFTIRNYLAGGYSDLHIKRANDGIFDVWVTNVQQPYFDDKEELEIEDKSSHNNLPLQTIFYGAPGTGKSHKVKEVTETLPKSDVFRTTFHPDSDYSTFVGCYKPKMVKAPIRDGSGHEITSACEDEKKRIAYEYEPQAFLKAYVRAYETNDPVFLVIEEINRGNCAQIFGDMFQLLDRNENGESDYAIKPETAIQEFLNEKLEDCDIADETIKSGEEMRLPANLHIWATMNTSDQSLFPIDSAFKRRWDWKYMPIDTRKESWGIKVNGTEYSWSSFLEKINEEIGSITNSEDKKLGFYFCKAENGIISAEKFVSKVLFYIYNDVFKDYGFESSKNKDLFKDGDNKLAFGTFYSDNGNIREEKVDLFLKNLGVEDAKRNNMISNDEEDEDGNSSTTESSSRNYDKFSINGSGRYAKNNLAAECVKKYIELNSDITVEEVLHNWSDFKNLVPHFMESKDEFDARTDNSKRSHEIPCNGSVLYVAHNGYGSNGKAQILMDSVNQKGWGLTIERHNA
ncbi:MAG: AAA family ATPase [Bacteroidales bacterium]|nr:AAA family ATPase [Bacteroidales bacterium]